MTTMTTMVAVMWVRFLPLLFSFCSRQSCLAGIILWPLMSFTILFNVLADLNLAEQDHHFLVKCTLGGDIKNARPRRCAEMFFTSSFLIFAFVSVV